MRSLFALLVCLFAAAVAALSTSGNRLLVVLDDVAEKESYSQFLGDLEGPCALYILSVCRGRAPLTN